MRKSLTTFAAILMLSALGAPAAHAEADATELSFWESVRDSDKPQELETYLKAYPDGTFAPLARLRIERLKGTGGSDAAELNPTAPLPPVQDCDRLAADPEDNDKVTDGVDFQALLPEQAAGACRSALASYPDIARFEFQLGRALLAVDLYPQAFEQFQKAADKGYGSAMVLLGIMYQYGYGIARDDKLAAEWYHKAAETGDAFAMTQLGLAHQKGEGVAPDYQEAFEWYHKAIERYRKAADKGEAVAMTVLGSMYEEGIGVGAPDDKEAIEWYRKAANKGYIDAMYRLGDMYKEGKGVAQDDKEADEWYRRAIEWYRKAADSGNSMAMADLGNMYKAGKGVAQDDKEADEWYRKAEKAKARAREALRAFGHDAGDPVDTGQSASPNALIVPGDPTPSEGLAKGSDKVNPAPGAASPGETDTAPPSFDSLDNLGTLD